MVGIIVVGNNNVEMAHAVNRVIALGGGIVLYADGDILAELALPLGAYLVLCLLEQLPKNLKRIRNKAKALGFTFNDVILSLIC